ASIDTQIVLDEREKTIPLNTQNFFKLNAETTGVYRVLYSGSRLAGIATEAAKNDSVLSLEDRMGLVLDGAALAKAGLMPTSNLLVLIDALRNETEYVVWTSLADSLHEVSTVWYEHEKIQELFKKFSKNIYTPLVQRLGYAAIEGESVDHRQLRVRAITGAAAAGESSVIKHLRELYDQYLGTGEVDPDLERLVFKTAVKYGGRAEFEAMKAVVAKPNTVSLGISALQALGATQDEALAAELIDSYLESVRSQDLYHVFLGFVPNRKFRRFAFKKFQERYYWLEDRLAGNYTLQSIIRIVTSGLSSWESHREVQDFFKNKDTSKYHMALAQALDKIAAKAAWIDRSTENILIWLETKEKA
ncbi:Aminopeptidase 2 mitochondrial, partial [Steccherinum ochraceum]